MRLILLTKGYVALIDDEDYELVSKYKWQVKITKDVTPRYYAQTTFWNENGIKVSLQMHRLLLHCQLNDKVIIDHIDNNGLNNQKKNLRVCNTSQNSANSKKKVYYKVTSKYKGVGFHKQRQKWRARVQLSSNRLNLGLFNSEEDAARAYDEAAKKYFGEFAKLNFPDLTS